MSFLCDGVQDAVRLDLFMPSQVQRLRIRWRELAAKAPLSRAPVIIVISRGRHRPERQRPVPPECATGNGAAALTILVSALNSRENLSTPANEVAICARR